MAEIKFIKKLNETVDFFNRMKFKKTDIHLTRNQVKELKEKRPPGLIVDGNITEFRGFNIVEVGE